MEKQRIEPIIVWLAHTYRSDVALRNFRDWYMQSQTPLKNRRGYNLSIDDNQKVIGGTNNFFSFLKRKDERIAVFLIVVWKTLKKDFVLSFIEEINALAKENDHRVYPILLDDFDELDKKDRSDEIWYEQEFSSCVKTLPCYCRTQMTVIGTRRCISLIERIMGYDIGDGSTFPDYDLKTQIAIARHINREDFNKYRPRKGAWKKYHFLGNDIPLIPKELFI